MTNSNVSRSRAGAWRALGRAGALGSLVTALSCSVYDSSLLGDNGSTLDKGGSTSGGSGGEGAAAGTGGSNSVAGSSGAQAGTVATSGSGGGGGSSGGGSGGDGGAGGDAGAVGEAGQSAAGQPPSDDGESIDNMEDGDAQIQISADGRDGYWYVGGDTTKGAKLDPPSSAFAMTKLADGDRSMFAARVKATGFTDWGSDIGFNFIQFQGAPESYDARAYCGVSYYGKAAGPTTVRFRIPDGNTTPDGGICINGGAAGTACYDHFGASAAFTTAWKQYSVKFSELSQSGTGYHPQDGKLAVDRLFALEWALPPSGTSYEIYIDDVRFITCP